MIGSLLQLVLQKRLLRSYNRTPGIVFMPVGLTDFLTQHVHFGHFPAENDQHKPDGVE
jgi:hypothetical protein